MSCNNMTTICPLNGDCEISCSANASCHNVGISSRGPSFGLNCESKAESGLICNNMKLDMNVNKSRFSNSTEFRASINCVSSGSKDDNNVCNIFILNNLNLYNN
eukprot:62455_1